MSAPLPRAKIPPPAAARRSAPFVKGGGAGAAKRGIWLAQQEKGSASYADRLLMPALTLGPSPVKTGEGSPQGQGEGRLQASENCSSTLPQ
jgi:hypothetical protein